MSLDARSEIPAESVNIEGSDPDALNERETAILSMMAGGATNEQMGLRLNVATATVRNNITAIRSKLGSPPGRLGRNSSHTPIGTGWWRLTLPRPARRIEFGIASRISANSGAISGSSFHSEKLRTPSL